MSEALAVTSTTTNKTDDAGNSRDLRTAVILILSGGPFDLTNPPEVRHRMDQIITDLNADPWVLANTQNQGLIFRLLFPQETAHIHQAKWRDVCKCPELLNAAAIIIVGHSNGGAAAMNIARYLQSVGKEIDLLFTADSVFTLDDNGDPYTVPPNVKLNLNTYSIPIEPIWWTIPFPFGKKNHRDADGDLTGLLNIGLAIPEPGASEHRDVFYDTAGGDPTDGGYQYPELIGDAALAVLRGATAQEVFDLAKSHMQLLSDRRKISISLEGDSLVSTLKPSDQDADSAADAVAVSDIESLHTRMTAIERVRLATKAPPQEGSV